MPASSRPAGRVLAPATALACLLSLATTLGPAPGSATPPLPQTLAPAVAPTTDQPSRPVLHLRDGDVRLGLDHSFGGPGARPLSAGERGAFVVQLAGPATSQDRVALQAAGASIVSYLPDYAYKVRLSPSRVAAVRSVRGVIAVERFAPAWRLGDGPSAKLRADATSLYSVTLDPDVDVHSARGALTTTGAVVTGAGRVLTVAASATQLRALAQRDEVADIQLWELPRTHALPPAGATPTAQAPAYNETARDIIKAGVANSRGYDGSTQTAGVADTGLGTGVPATAFKDLPAARITSIIDWPTQDKPNCLKATPDGPRDVSSGHGTHTAVSVVGGGNAEGIGRAPAPAAKLVFQAVEDWAETFGTCSIVKTGYVLSGVPSDIGDLFQQAYAQGARVHSNSWGSTRLGEYTDQSMMVDTWTSLHHDMLVTFSAGNEGGDVDKNGVIDQDSVGAPATAKNVLAVGASENSRASHPCDKSLTYGPTEGRESTIGSSCAAAGGDQKIPTWGQWFPGSYPANPVKDDLQSGNPEQVAAFSGRGPTDDGRIKPDVVAPGSWVLSGYSPLFQIGYSSTPNPQDGKYQNDGYGFPYSSTYKYFSGTSMSNPLAAGGAVLVRDYYSKKWGVDPSAALVKATLINSAHDQQDEDGNPATANLPVPNIHEGWGRVDLDAATAATAAFVDEGAALQTGISAEQSLTVASGQPLRVSLVWTDVPAASNAAKSLVNDLDLELVSPSGQVYRGNVLSGGWSQTGGSADRVNTVENVLVQAPAAGTWTVRVTGANVPTGPQSYALVMSGKVPAGTANHNPVISPLDRQTFPPTQPLSLSVQAADADGDTLTWSATGLPAGLTINPSTGVISGTPTEARSHEVTVVAADGRGGEGRMALTLDIGYASVKNLLTNAGFEEGTAGWSGTTSGIMTTARAREGLHAAVLNANGQSLTSAPVTVPTGAVSPRAWVWVDVTSTDGAFRDYDRFTAEVVDTNGTVIAKLGELSNMDQKKGWIQLSADLASARGKSVKLRMTSTQDRGMPTTFTVDTVAITDETGATAPSTEPQPG